MKQLLYALILRIPFTIDRIEDQWAIVEWANMALSTIWNGHFPELPQEGQNGIANLWLCNDPKIEIINRDPLTIKNTVGSSVIPYSFLENHIPTICIAFEIEKNGFVEACDKSTPPICID